MKTGITAHMIVKNEDQWVWYAVQSVLPYVDTFLVIDTGSTDHTLECLQSIHSPKLRITQHQISSPSELTELRNEQIRQTKTPWLWIVDGDEVYPKLTALEIVTATAHANVHGIVVRRHDLLGDIYHRQSESVGSYSILSQTGHLVTRLIHISSFPGLHVERPYPDEAYFDAQNNSIHEHDDSFWYVTEHYLYHAMYLRRSSLGSNLPMFNRSKYKVEKGLSVPGPIPAVFSLPRPSFVPDALTRRSTSYELAAAILTPIKELKRKIL